MTEPKKPFYVSVQAGSIVPQEGDTNFEFEVEATDAQMDALQQLFDKREEADNAAYFRAHVPFLEYEHDAPNDAADRELTAVYRMLYELGTPETRRHIVSMGVLGGELMREPVDVPPDPTP